MIYKGFRPNKASQLIMCGIQLGIKLLKKIKKWRKCMGIEPTRDVVSAPHRI